MFTQDCDVAGGIMERDEEQNPQFLGSPSVRMRGQPGEGVALCLRNPYDQLIRHCTL